MNVIFKGSFWIWLCRWNQLDMECTRGKMEGL